MTMRTTGKKRAIRTAIHRLGLRTMPKGVVDVLAQQGIQVDEECVRQGWFELLKKATQARAGELTRPGPSPAVRRRPQGFPGRRGK
jgi:hypothetical protein